MPPLTREQVSARLDIDAGYFARNCVRIVGPGGKTVALVPKRAQQGYFDKIAAQREAGLPLRFIILKARKLGFSTATESVIVQRVTRNENHHALIVGQDNDTAGELFAMAEFMVAHLPTELRPPIANHQRGIGRGYLYFAEPSRQVRTGGKIGLNSSLRVTNAKETGKGRGFTIRSMHLTEVAHWDSDQAMVAMLNAVPTEPDTFVCLESTANGTNWFKDRWDAAVAGESSYVPIFAPWHDEPAYRVKLTAEQVEEFWSNLYGEGPWGEDEERLVTQFGCDAEQLVWRRRKIVDDCDSKIEIWNQEYPASPADAFVSSGRHVFAISFIQRVIATAEETDQLGERGVFQTAVSRKRVFASETIDVPTSAVWVPKAATGFGDRHPWWRVWEHPRDWSTVAEQRRRLDAGEISQAVFERIRATAIRAPGADKSGPPDEDAVTPPGQYIVTVDTAGGEEMTSAKGAWHAVQVIDHHTFMQAAEYRSRIDTDLLALEALHAALYYYGAWIAVEITGFYGTPVLKDNLHRRFRYNRLYRRRRPDVASDEPTDLLGWSTDRRTKPQLEIGYGESLRTGTDGVRSALLAAEHLTYIYGRDGKSGPEAGSFSDLLMAWMIAQQLAQEIRPRTPRPRGSVTSGPYAPPPRNPRTGY